jgi:hypothetical protein
MSAPAALASPPEDDNTAALSRPDDQVSAASTAAAVQQILRALTTMVPRFTEMDADEENAVREAQIQSDAEARAAMRMERNAHRKAAAETPVPPATTRERLAWYLHKRARERDTGDAAASSLGGHPFVSISSGSAAPSAPHTRTVVNLAARAAASRNRSLDIWKNAERSEGEWAPGGNSASPPAGPVASVLGGKLRDLGDRIVMAKEQRLAFVAQLTGASRSQEPPSSSGGGVSLSGVPETYPSAPRRRRGAAHEEGGQLWGEDGGTPGAAKGSASPFKGSMAARRAVARQEAASRRKAAEAERAAAEAVREAEVAAEEELRRKRERQNSPGAGVILVMHDPPAAEAARWRRQGGPNGAPLPMLVRDAGTAAPQAALEGLDAALRQGTAMLWVGRRARHAEPGPPSLPLRGRAPAPRSEALQSPIIGWAALMASHDPVASGPEAEVLFVPAAKVGPVRALIQSRLERAAVGGFSLDASVRSPVALPPADPARALDAVALVLAKRYGIRIQVMPELLPFGLAPDNTLPPIAASAPMPSSSSNSASLLPPAAAAPELLYRRGGPARPASANGSLPHRARRAASAGVTQTVRDIIAKRRAAAAAPQEAPQPPATPSPALGGSRRAGEQSEAGRRAGERDPGGVQSRRDSEAGRLASAPLPRGRPR